MARGFLDDDRPRRDRDDVQKSDLVDLAVRLIHETPLAWLVDDGRREVWIPKSRGELQGGILTIPERLAIEKRLI